MEKFIQELKEKTPILNQPYFRSLNNGDMEKEKFKETQVCFYDAVLFFSRPMFFIAGGLNSYSEREIILENIHDEHGNGSIENSHGNTYRKHLLSLGINDKQIKNRKPTEATSSFNKTLMEIALNRKKEISASTMGMIEERYAEISQVLIQAVIKNGWLNKKRVTHYKLHEELDLQHARGFYKLIKSGWSNSTKKEQIQRGLSLGNKLIIGLYNDLL